MTNVRVILTKHYLAFSAQLRVWYFTYFNLLNLLRLTMKRLTLDGDDDNNHHFYRLSIISYCNNRSIASPFITLWGRSNFNPPILNEKLEAPTD